MHAVVMTMILAVTTFDYLVLEGWLPPFWRFLPEMLSMLVAAYVVVAGIQSRFRYVRPIYWLVFGLLLFIAVCGIAINMVPAGTTLAGMRTFMRAIPFFFLPAVFAFTPSQVRAQITLLLVICVIQAPIALDQRLTSWARGYGSGDLTIGTLMDSGMLSVFLVGASCLLTAAYLRKRITGLAYLALILIVLFPTAINETKATILLLPVGLMTVFLVASKKGQLATNIVKACLVVVVLLPPFVLLYDHFQPEYRPGLMEFLSDPARVQKYQSTGVEIGDGIGQAPRLDSLTSAVGFVSEDPIRFFFGVGIGNASPSALGVQYQGRYSSLLGPFMYLLFNRIILELGFLSLGLLLICKLNIFLDCREVARLDEGIFGTIALGWTGVVVLATISLIYSDLSWSSAITYLFWYLSGLVAAWRMRLQLPD